MQPHNTNNIRIETIMYMYMCNSGHVVMYMYIYFCECDIIKNTIYYTVIIIILR